MTTPIQWELAGEIIDQGAKHAALTAVSDEWKAVEAALAEIKDSGDRLRRVGAGRTEHPTLVLARLVPALRALSETAATVAAQMEERLA